MSLSRPGPRTQAPSDLVLGSACQCVTSRSGCELEQGVSRSQCSLPVDPGRTPVQVEPSAFLRACLALSLRRHAGAVKKSPMPRRRRSRCEKVLALGLRAFLSMAQCLALRFLCASCCAKAVMLSSCSRQIAAHVTRYRTSPSTQVGSLARRWSRRKLSSRCDTSTAHRVARASAQAHAPCRALCFVA